jgi:hypothetical protein
MMMMLDNMVGVIKASLQTGEVNKRNYFGRSNLYSAGTRRTMYPSRAPVH